MRVGGGFRGRTESSIVDAAAGAAAGMGVLRVQFQSEAGLQERSRHPVGSEGQQAAGRFHHRFRGFIEI